LKNLIVNADDFGASHAINLGVVEAHRNGILTSASMMVDAPASEEAARVGLREAGLGVGLHIVIEAAADSPEAEILRQFERFVALTGKAPTHIDAHHNVHWDERVLPAFLAVAERCSVPLRGHCGVHHIPSFYGQWDGETHLEGVGLGALGRIVATEIEDGFNELCCHPGYVDGELTSSYTVERQAELETLCNPAAAALLSERDIRLATFRELAQR
jgi:predicted glycoside hydrolase/deacetylase ChbG (UPF0249 family)